MKVLGISAFYHDSAAALVDDKAGIVAAAQEERFTRRKHDLDFPRNAIRFCLEKGNISLDQLDAIVFYEKPFLKFERLLETYLHFAPRGFGSFSKAIPVWVKEKLFQKKNLLDALNEFSPEADLSGKIFFSEHHLSHAASAFFPSPFERAAVLTMDGVGEWATGSVFVGHGNRLSSLKEMHFPHSLGLLYSAFTYYTGFKVNSGEYKVMGLGPYGDPKYASKIMDALIDLKEDGSFSLNQDYFGYCTGLKMTNSKFEKLFGEPVRKPSEPLQQFHMDVAASIQFVCEEIMLRLTRSIAKETGEKNLCLAGGVALNCVANGKILRDSSFEKIWIQPAAGDAGGSLGAAFFGLHMLREKPRLKTSGDAMRGAYLGPEFGQHEIEKRLSAAGAVFSVRTDQQIIEDCVAALVEEKAIGWFQGPMEFGPRALGGRSIIADPRSADMQSRLNLKIKYRESFRPFAPAVLREKVADWFQIDEDSPYMLLVADVREELRKAMTDEQKKLFGIQKLNVSRSNIPAVTHIDYSARIQTVHQETNPKFHQLLSAFNDKTGCPVVVNTSFNVRGEPIVCTPEDAFRCFMGTEMDVLAIGNCLLLKADQNMALKKSYEGVFEND